MNRKTLIKIHLLATAVASLCICFFWGFSLSAEIKGDILFIRQVKTGILYFLPILIIFMPILAISGKKLAGKSQSLVVKTKEKYMRMIAFNGMTLIILAVFLYYRVHFEQIDGIFWAAQTAEFLFGAGNLVLISLNAKAGFAMSAKK